MTNITRFTPVEDIFGDLMKGFWVKPVALPEGGDLNEKATVATYKDGVLDLTLPKKPGAGVRRVAVQ